MLNNNCYLQSCRQLSFENKARGSLSQTVCVSIATMHHQLEKQYKVDQHVVVLLDNKDSLGPE